MSTEGDLAATDSVFDEHGLDTVDPLDAIASASGDILSEWERRHDIFSVDAWNRRNRRLLDSYIRFTYPRTSREHHARWLLDNPYLCRTVIENWITSDEEKWRRLIQCFALPKPRIRIIYVIGEPGSGKSTWAYDFAKAVQDEGGRPIVERSAGADTPLFVDQVSHISRAPHGSIYIDNEAGVNENSQNTITKLGKALTPAVNTIRHQDMIGVWVSQNTMSANPVLLRMAQMIVFKPLGLTQAGSERGVLRRKIAYFREMMPRNPSQSFIISKHFPPSFIRRPEPEWQTDEISTSYRRLASLDEAMRLVTQWRADGNSWEVCSTLVTTRYAPMGAERVQKACIEWNNGIDPKTGEKPKKRRRSAEDVEADAQADA